MDISAHRHFCYTRGYTTPHGSLEGVGGLKTNEAYHSKADALLIPEMYFFENLPTPFFGIVCLVKFGPFSALLALPVMKREEYGKWHIKRFLTSCSVALAWLRSRTSLGL